MNKEQQRIAIAEACGWTAEQDSNGYWRAVNKKNGNAVELWLSEQNVWSVGIPDYLNDLNAMHDAEQYLFKDVHQWRYFINNLRDATGEDPFLAVAHATAPQRAEAFLRTLELWEEEE